MNLRAKLDAFILTGEIRNRTQKKTNKRTNKQKTNKEKKQ